jgi:hypothetical protein
VDKAPLVTRALKVNFWHVIKGTQPQARKSHQYGRPFASLSTSTTTTVACADEPIPKGKDDSIIQVPGAHLVVIHSCLLSPFLALVARVN